MLPLDIELRTIKIMLTIERAGSITKAAEILHMSQPALTQYIKRIELQLSFPLYKRERGRCYPTEAAKILLSEGRLLLNQYHSMINKMTKMTNPKKTNITLGWPMGYTVHYANKIKTIESNINFLNVQIIEDSVEKLIELVLEKKVNFLLIPALYSHPKLRYATLCREEFFLAVPQDHMANQLINNNNATNYADLAKLTEMPFISVNTKPYQEFIKPIFNGAGYKPNIIFTCNNWDISHSLVEDGLGLAILPQLFVNKDNTKVNYYPIKSDYRTYRTFSIVSHQDQLLSTEMETFLDSVKSNLGDHYTYQPFDYSTLNKIV